MLGLGQYRNSNEDVGAEEYQGRGGPKMYRILWRQK